MEVESPGLSRDEVAALEGGLALLGSHNPKALLEGEAGQGMNLSDFDGLCLVGTAEEAPPVGWKEIRRQKFLRRMPLWQGLEKILQSANLPSALAAPFRTGGLFGVIGSRPCKLPAPGLVARFCLPSDRLSPPENLEDGWAGAALSVFGLGHLPIIGATAASVLTASLGWLLLAGLGQPWATAGFLVLVLGSSWICVVKEKWAHRRFFAEDPREVVLDEVAGMALALLAVPVSHAFTGTLVALVLFRFFDTTKLGVHWVEERNWPGGVVWDDLIAGAYAAAGTLLIFFLLR